MIKVLLVDDHELIRVGLSQILGDTPNIQVVGQADSGEQALVLARRLEPDVVIVDVDMPGMGGVEATRRLSVLPSGPKVIVVSVHCDPPYPQRLLAAGAVGYLTKGGPGEEIITAVRTVHGGKPYVAPDIAGTLALSAVSGDSSPLESLSPREMQIMMLLVRGTELQCIAKSLNLSPKTVATHRYRIYGKLGVGNDVELTHLALRHGMLDTP